MRPIELLAPSDAQDECLVRPAQKAQPGENITFYINVTNDGEVQSQGVYGSALPIPPGTEYQGSSSRAAVSGGDSLTCEIRLTLEIQSQHDSQHDVQGQAEPTAGNPGCARTL